MAESIYRIDPEPRAPKLDLDLRTTPSSAITSRIMDAPVSKRTVAVEKQKMSTPPSRALDEVTMVPLKPPAEEVVSPSNTEHVTSDDDDLDPYADYLDYWLAGTVSAPSEDSETLSRFSRPVSVVSSTPSRRSIVAPRPPSSVHPARRAPSSASTRSQRLSIQSGTTSIPARRSSNGATLISSFNLIYGHALNDGTNSTSSSPISEPMYAETMRSQRIHAWAVMAASSSLHLHLNLLVKLNLESGTLNPPHHPSRHPSTAVTSTRQLPSYPQHLIQLMFHRKILSSHTSDPSASADGFR
ncbi:hypothetical protein BC829DRAFT_132661 [Chytridium lagenaria]|nr:hypothetical protein BC829DRAFT_132661 [Chytridium lagenaria]